MLIGASGRLTADVVQSCVVTMAPVAGDIDEKIEEVFAPEGYEPGAQEEDDDQPESFDGQEIDVGELAAQLLSLSLDPYPRAPDPRPRTGRWRRPMRRNVAGPSRGWRKC